MLVATFLANVFCGFFSCVHLNNYPSDPLLARAQQTLSPNSDTSDNEISRILKRNGASDGGISSRNNGLFLEKVEPIVFTDAGSLEGYMMKTIRQRNIFAFEGVPYGESRANGNRFKPPVPKRPWEGLRSARKPGPYCLQFNALRPRIMGDEDCLYLNVYTPKLPQSRDHKPLPVIVFIHGGSWYLGSGTEYGPSYLLEEDVILVTINYRLGILGFLSTGDDELPGNNGLKDQALALKWVHENIKEFGGDAERVTIMGHSSGAASVQLHMISNVSREYFSNGISISGSAFLPWAIMSRDRMRTVNQRLANVTRCPYDEYKTAPYVNCLKKVNPHLLAGRILKVFDWAALPLVPIGVVVEKPGQDAFLTVHPEQAYREGLVAKKPWICVRTPDEGHLITTVLDAFGVQVGLKMIWKKYAPIFLEYSTISKNPEETTDTITKFYIGNENPRMAKNTSVFGDILTDRELSYGIHKAAQAHSEIAPTYSSLYTFKGKASLAYIMGVDKDTFGVSHVDSLFTIFNIALGMDIRRSIYVPGYRTTDAEFQIVKLLSNLYSNFATKGEPLYRDESGQHVKIWEPVNDPRHIQVLQVGKEVRMIPETDRQRLKFWESLGLDDMKPWIPFE